MQVSGIPKNIQPRRRYVPKLWMFIIVKLCLLSSADYNDIVWFIENTFFCKQTCACVFNFLSFDQFINVIMDLRMSST